MPSVHDVLRWANRSDVAREITRRGYRVSGETLNRWYRNRSEVPAIVERIVFELFGVGTAKEPAPFEWDRLIRQVDAIARTVGASLEEDPLIVQAAADVAREATNGPLRDGGPADQVDDGPPAQRPRRNGSRRGR